MKTYFTPQTIFNLITGTKTVSNDLNNPETIKYEKLIALKLVLIEEAMTI